MSQLPTFEEMRQQAYKLLGDAEDWMRSDWRPVGSELTDDQAKGRTEFFKAVAKAKAALNKAARR